MAENTNNPNSDENFRSRKKPMNASDGQYGQSTENDGSLPYKTCDEYVKHLDAWIVQCQYWQWFTRSYPLMMSSLSSAHIQHNQYSTDINSNLNWFANNANLDANAPQLGRIYAIPRVWKRVIAEVLDFFFLLILKLMVTYIAVDYLELIDIDKFDLSLLDYDFDALQIAYELTSEIIIIEMIHRFIVCAYETICLHSGQMNRIGGSTPGKAIFGIVVVSCDRIDEVGDGLIRVIPAKNIGILWSLLRAVFKNLSTMLFIPASLTVLFSSHNRAVYDIACKCIVVEEIAIDTRVHRRRN